MDIGSQGIFPTPEELDRLTAFLHNLAQALHTSGMPAHDLERNLNAIGQRFGVNIECIAVLTMLTLIITTGQGTKRLDVQRLRFYDYNMARLIALENLIRGLNPQIDLEHYETQLQEIMDAPPLWSGWSFVALGFLLSGAIAVLLGGGWIEVLCGGVIGMLFVGGFLAMARVPRLAPAAPVILCTGAAIVAHLLALALPQQSIFISALAGVVLLLPGFTFTIAMSELATQNLLSGTGRLAGVFVLLFMMGAGLTIGTHISQNLLHAHSTATLAPVPAWITWPAIAILGVSLLGVLQAPLRSVHILVGSSLLAWAVYALVSSLVGNIVGAFAGAFAVAGAGHLYARLSGEPDILAKIPGLIALVPGSMGLRGVHALIEKDSTAGLQLMTDMATIGAVLAVGLLLADNIAPLLFARLKRKP